MQRIPKIHPRTGATPSLNPAKFDLDKARRGAKALADQMANAVAAGRKVSPAVFAFSNLTYGINGPAKAMESQLCRLGFNSGLTFSQGLQIVMAQAEKRGLPVTLLTERHPPKGAKRKTVKEGPYHPSLSFDDEGFRHPPMPHRKQFIQIG